MTVWKRTVGKADELVAMDPSRAATMTDALAANELVRGVGEGQSFESPNHAQRERGRR